MTSGNWIRRGLVSLAFEVASQRIPAAKAGAERGSQPDFWLSRMLSDVQGPGSHPCLGLQKSMP